MRRGARLPDGAGAADDPQDRQRRGTRQLLVARGVFFGSAYVVSAMLSRTLGPAAYGVYGVVVSQLAWLDIVVHAGVPAATAKLVAGGSRDPGDVERSARALLIAVSAFLFLFGWFLAPAIASLMRIQGGETLFRIAIFDVPLVAIYASYEGILYGHRRFGLLASVMIVHGLARIAAVSAFTGIGMSVERALMAVVVSSLAMCVFVATQYPPSGLRISRRSVGEIARLASPMALCLISGQVLVNLDLWALKSLWSGSSEVVGQYVASLTLARMLIVIPTVQAGVLFSSVAWASASGDSAGAVRHIQEASRFAVVLGTPACVLLGMNGSEVLAVLFSRPYAEGQRFLPIHLAAFGLFAILDVFAHALMAVGRHRAVAAVLTAAVPFVWACNYVLIPALGPAGAALSMLAGMSAVTIVTGMIAGAHFGALIRTAMVVRVIVAAGIVALASAAFAVQGPIVIAKVAGLGGLYLCALYLLKEITLRDFGLAIRR